jgi:dipeptidyl aminopeptidase/acylaminoacyl peptidase
MSSSRTILFWATIMTATWYSGFDFDRESSAADDPRRPPAITCEGVPIIPDGLADRLRQYQNTRSAGFRGWSPDGKGIMIQTRFGNTSQLHRVYQPAGRREQITFFDEPANGRFVPQNPEGMLLISMGSGGDERYQVYAMTPKHGGKATLLTDGKSRNLLGPVRKDGLFAIVSNNSRNGKDTDLYIVDPNTPGKRDLLYQTDGEYWIADDWSRDGSQVLMRHYVSINECYPAVLDVATSKKTAIPIPGNPEKSAYGSMSFSNDGMHAYLNSDAVSEFKQLAKVDLKSMDYTWLSQDIPWDVSSIVVAPPGGILPNEGLVAFTTNEDGASGLYLLFGEKHRKLDVPMGIVSSLSFSPDGTQLGFSLSKSTRPTDVYSLSLLDGNLTRWTYSESGGLPIDRFVEPEVVRFKTFDDRKIPAFYFKPKTATKAKPVPVVINIHGGPESQARPTFDPQTQFYVAELGFAVIRPNVRGSRGYGKSYLLLDNGPKREDSVKDIGALLDWIEEQPELDSSRVAVYGGSYGGYMVLSSLTHYSDRLRAGVDIVGIASFKTFLENTSAYRRDLRRAEYGDERTPEMKAVFERIDPINNAQKINTSLLVAHGENDPRVPFSEAQQIAPKVRANGQTVWTVYANNEGHGFARKENRDYVSAVITTFLMEHLK